MDVLRKELNSIYKRQELDSEQLDMSEMRQCAAMAATCVTLDDDCRVITDASADRCIIVANSFARIIGIREECGMMFSEVDSSDEDAIYLRLHPEDLVDKRMLEYEFFKFVDALSPERKTSYKASCRIRIKGATGQYIYCDNTTQVLRLSPRGKIWLILCCYKLSARQEEIPGVSPHIINTTTGEIADIRLSEQRSLILTLREKEVLNLIRQGKPSKQIADILGISINTVNRHRQNILEKLSVGNSMEAVMAATAMKLL